MVVLDLSVSLHWYTMWMLWLSDCDTYIVVYVACVYAERV